MNLHEQLGALEVGVAQLIQAVVAPQAQNIPETPAANAASQAPAPQAEQVAPTAASASEDASAQEAAAEEKPTLSIGRPAQNVITMTIAGKTVSLHPEQVGQLIEELANARASMTPEPPMGVPAWLALRIDPQPGHGGAETVERRPPADRAAYRPRLGAVHVLAG